MNSVGVTAFQSTLHPPQARTASGSKLTASSAGGLDQDDIREPIDALEIFEHIRDITDPEHPYTLEQLNVVEEKLITVDDAKGRVKCVRPDWNSCSRTLVSRPSA